MTAIHVYWTPPQKEEDKINYFYDSTSLEKSFTLNRYTTILSALWWKKLNGSIKLFTDNKGLELYKRYKLDTLYDEIDTDTLENYEGNPKLWTAGKLYCMGVQALPFCFLDNDLIIREKIKLEDYKKQVGFTHWELPRGKEYEIESDCFLNNTLRSNLKLDFNHLVTNTSFFYIKSKKFQKVFLEEHFLNYKISSHNIDTSVWMYTDQVIPSQIIRNIGSSYFTLDNRLHIPYSSQLTNDFRSFVEHKFNEKERITEIPIWVTIENSNTKKYKYEHLWFFKAHIIKNDSSFNNYIESYTTEITKNFPEMKFLCE
jgi:hypothetical protein